MLPISSKSPYSQIEGLYLAAQQLIDFIDSSGKNNTDVYRLFITLIHIERAMDAYRVLVPAGSGFDYKEEKEHANKLLDLLRLQIHDLREFLNDDQVRDALNEAGRDFQLRFLKASPKVTPKE